MHLTHTDHRPDAAGGHDDDVGVGHDRGQVVQARSAHRDAVVRGDVPGQMFGVGQRPVDHHHVPDALTRQMRGGQPTHRAGTDHDGRAQPRRIGITGDEVLARCSATDTTEAPARSMPVSVWTRLPTRSACWASSCRVRPAAFSASALR